MGKKEAVGLLVIRGADIESKNGYGNAALDIIVA
jgi:ankyrin repeat protein